MCRTRDLDHFLCPARNIVITVCRLVSFVAILLLLITAAPVLACATDSGMSREERACCRAMHGSCGEMANTGCCKVKVRADTHPPLASATPDIRFVQAFIQWVVLSFAPGQSIPPAVLRYPDEHSPPGLLIAELTVLRI